jgi:hypothetical protein
MRAAPKSRGSASAGWISVGPQASLVARALGAPRAEAVRARRGETMTASRKLLCVVYAVLAAGALVAAWWQNLAYFAQAPGAGMFGFIRAAYANPAAASLANDLLLLCAAAIVWMVVEARRHGIRFVWVYVALSFVVAISVTFPLFLIARERRLAAAGG